MAKFRILHGRHSEGKYTSGPHINKPIIYYAGDVVDSKTDLLKHNPPGGRAKFIHVPDSTPSTKKEFNAPPEVNKMEEPSDDLDQLTVPELRAYANDEEIDITGLNKKQDIVERIRQVTKEVIDSLKV